MILLRGLRGGVIRCLNSSIGGLDSWRNLAAVFVTKRWSSNCKRALSRVGQQVTLTKIDMIN